MPAHCGCQSQAAPPSGSGAERRQPRQLRQLIQIGASRCYASVGMTGAQRAPSCGEARLAAPVTERSPLCLPECTARVPAHAAPYSWRAKRSSVKSQLFAGFKIKQR
jgi:hypothetical protein